MPKTGSSMPIPPSEVSTQARIAARTSWLPKNTPDRAARTAAARRGLEVRFEREADPDGVLGPVERAKAVENVRRLYYCRLALKSAQSRRRQS